MGPQGLGLRWTGVHLVLLELGHQHLPLCAVELVGDDGPDCHCPQVLTTTIKTMNLTQRWYASQMIRDVYVFIQHARMMDHESDHGRNGGGPSWPWYVSGMPRGLKVT